MDLARRLSAKITRFIPAIDMDQLWPSGSGILSSTPVARESRNVITLAEAIAGRMNDLIDKGKRMLVNRAFEDEDGNITRTSQAVACRFDDLKWFLNSRDTMPVLEGPVLWRLENQQTIKTVDLEVEEALVKPFLHWSNRQIARFYKVGADGKRIESIRKRLENPWTMRTPGRVCL
jgi:hypothetical protein